MQQREITGRFNGERHVFDNGDTRTIIGDITLANGETITIKGDAPEGHLRRGLPYRFWGHTKRHHKYGDQFWFSTFIAEEPATEQGITTYLRQIKGIGPSTAGEIWERHGPDAVRMLRECPDKCTTKRFKIEAARDASKWLQANHRTERAKVDLIGLLDGRGFPRKVIDQAIEVWGSRAADVVRRDPYKLMRFRGCGFLGTDRMYLDLGRKPDRLKRTALCAWYAIASQSDGHTWFPLSEAAGAIRSSVASASLNLERTLELATRSGMLTVCWADDNDLGIDLIAESKNAIAEARVADEVAGQLYDRPHWPDLDQGDLSDHQFEQLRRATAGRIGCLTGSPGTGKTHTAGALLRSIAEQAVTSQIAACAPTGKAAVRLQESLLSHGVSVEAMTIHRLLRVQASDDGGGFEFEHGAGNPLPFRFVVIDEASMIDASLMSSLLAARDREACFLFLGDTQQLAPVGHGAPLRDMITAGVACGDLVEIRRNSGAIVECCRDIKMRQTVSNIAPRFDLDNGRNLICLDTESDHVDLLQQFLTSLRASDFDPVWDAQVLVAVNKKSPLARKAVNETLQRFLNPDGETRRGNPFRVRDKAINLKNGWFPSLDPGADEANADGKCFIANGELAEVVAVEPARTIVRLTQPDRVCVIPHGAKSDGDESGGSLSSWDLGYAISTHKSQGSEWPFVIVLVDSYGGARRLCTRNWIYTAISRAKRGCVLIGERWLVADMARKDGLRRLTRLPELISKKRMEAFGDRLRLSDAEIDDLFASPARCPHDEDPAECDACMMASDFAFDSAREMGAFGK